MTLDDFVTKYNGKGIDFDGAYGFQCMDLAHRYAVDVVGIDIPAVPAAKDEWTKTISGYDKIKNTPDGLPQKGDIVIFGTDVGAYGHIAVFLEGNLTTFTSFDQNWPVGSLCHKQPHNYKGVLGWFHPKQTVTDAVSVPKDTFENLVTNSGQRDNIADKYSFDKSGNIDKLIFEKVSGLDKERAQLQESLDKCQLSLNQQAGGGSNVPSDDNTGSNSNNPDSNLTGIGKVGPIGIPTGTDSTSNVPQTNPTGNQATYSQSLFNYIVGLIKSLWRAVMK